MVPDMFQAPISAPTLSRIKTGVVMEASAFFPDLAMSSQECPFFRRIRATTMEQRINATCMGPSIASVPNT
jgi:hypothetical protein